jgi:hypothetical protein
MSVVRPDVRRFCALLILMGAVGFGSARSAHAGQRFYFSQEFSLEDASLNPIDAFGAYWFFNGEFFLDTTLDFDGYGQASVAVTGYTDSKGLNYRLGTGARMQILFNRVVDAYFDPADGNLRAKIPFCLYLLGEGGGALPSEMRISIFQEGVVIDGVTLGCDFFTF